MKEIIVIEKPTRYGESIFDTLDIQPNTKSEYQKRILKFFDFMNHQTITRNLLLAYKQYLRDDNTLGIASKNKYLTTARIALREMYRRGLTPVDLSVGVSSFQQNIRHKVNGLTEEEVVKICNYLRN